MFWLLLTLLIILVLFLFIIFTKLTIYIYYSHFNDNDDLKIELRVWFGLIRYRIKVPVIKVDDDSPSIVVKSKSHFGDTADEDTETDVNQLNQDDFLSKLQSVKYMLHKVFGMNVIVKKFLQKVTIKNFEWQTLMGVGDAAYTGMMTGALWAIKGGIIGLLSHYMRLKEMPQLTVTPHFQAAVIHTRLTCMFQFRIGHAILAGLKLIKFWKGGKPRLKGKSDFQEEKTKSVS
ncbi:DUF2953 domain-containing protein [Neobacillus cucumis]|uniref:DUF2953 domain-containing protein n=1 Tax=Neobacillus cucumis TaxID=1740721 RepID=UPI00203A9348|nr:DUF2953 domain-containing protein [Neobacillus cucumis]MCM3725409.1 DUF2953 domain-containing protein [Neobacillus cucumis]